jgi:SAM-dependent methyltransferase
MPPVSTTSGSASVPALPGQLPGCPVCRSCSWTSHLTGTRLRACRRCGTVLNDRSASREEEEQRYASYSTGPASDELWIAAAQWRWLDRQLRSTIRSGTLSLLDVGCGHGAFLHVARQHSVRVAGVELDPAGVQSCRRAELPVVSGSVFTVGVPKGPWDVITLWDVLEHLEHPTEALRLIRQQLAPGGLLVLRGRNARLHVPLKRGYGLVRRVAQRWRVPDLSCVHRWGFGPWQYSQLLSSAGMHQMRLHPGIPTPGDRSGAMGPAVLAASIKQTVRALGLSLFWLSFHTAYPFPSVLVTARRPTRFLDCPQAWTSSPAQEQPVECAE